ncbi:hypothetical protein [Terrabacter sp. C0L_2]|uniref:hypothetical protein n=1 Tax=Terrabacter sp. C0L_2 TaxID=3108389 RepID=UPI002ED228DB|nr:hypothetical protein U5C87_12430 [Terrabacter sp. C0L_2]
MDEASVVAHRALVQACRAALSVLPVGSVFSHVTAAQLHGLPLSYAMEEDCRLHVTRPITSNRVRLPSVIGHRALHARRVVEIEGLPVVDLADTWVDLGELVGRGKPVGLDDLVVLGDACATRLGSRVPLIQACLLRNRPRGKRTLLEAYEEIRVGSASPRESLARLVLTRGGLPEPQLNEPIFASWDPGLLLGVGDLVWRVPTEDGGLLKVVGEYQGELFHSGDEQRLHDGIRGSGMARDGWDVQEMWKADLNSSQSRVSTLQRFAAALHVPSDRLRPQDVTPRFFSSHAIDQAVQREMQRSAWS